ncbi:ankyrin repeat domain-containing protein [Campylobacter showae]|uniref:ankyrin repeat domain-containing protein n=1 Tax=Campylobacter showae TaxID=204 RepID=UPI0028D6CCA7|nr:ankyrin repeat domain-containing protein [Campylobacter showae]
MKRFALGFAALFLVVFINFLYEKLSRLTHFTVTPDTKIDPNSELAKYVTQEEIDDFAFRYWDIDEYEENNATLNALRNLLRLKDTDKILNFMTRNGLGADVKMKANTTPLIYASFYDDETTAKRLMEMGANAHAKDNYKLSPLAYAIENNSTKTVKLLLDSGVRLEEVKAVQFYLTHAVYALIDSIVIDKDDVHINYGFMDIDSKDAVEPFHYVISNNLLEISKMFFELGYKPECKFNAQRYEEFDCFDRLSIIPNYEPMLNLLLDNNVSGQPTSEELKGAYKKCHDKVGVFTAAKEGYIYKMNQGRDEESEEKIKKKYDKYKYAPYSLLYEDGLLQYKPKPPNLEQIKRFDDTINFYSKHCLDENATFKDTESFVKWTNEEERRENVLRFLEAHKNNPAKVIYIDANISSQDKEKLISNKLIQKLRSKDAAER